MFQRPLFWTILMQKQFSNYRERDKPITSILHLLVFSELQRDNFIRF